MNRSQYILSKVAEEAAEISQAALKCQQFGGNEQYERGGDTNFQRLLNEFLDLLACMEILAEEEGLEDAEARIALWVDNKKDKVEKYWNFSKELGECA